MSSGAWAAAGGIGTVSAVNADSYDEDGNPIEPEKEPELTPEEKGELLISVEQLIDRPSHVCVQL